eukprot:TRINITY_DN8111_c1_g1_i1.p1 TRINITY_DN8111_c1_g1~~TRINITY_DN8111_c1_g1_i1.p1  ORF type:complete len:226 (+),score=56.62 TRINITY_DN8111_c1_g1_i1:304-981(+)
MGCGASGGGGAAPPPPPPLQAAQRKQSSSDSSERRPPRPPSTTTAGGHGYAHRPTDTQARAMYVAYMKQERCEASDEFDMILAALQELEGVDPDVAGVMACAFYMRWGTSYGDHDRSPWFTIYREFAHVYAGRDAQAEYVFDSILLGDVHVKALHAENAPLDGPCTNRLVVKFCRPYDASGAIAGNIWGALSDRGILHRARFTGSYGKVCSMFRPATRADGTAAA